MMRSMQHSFRTSALAMGFLWLATTGGIFALAANNAVVPGQDAQPPTATPHAPDNGGPPEGPPGPPPMRARRPPLERHLHVGPPGRWWNNPEMAQKLGLSSAQQHQMDDIFQQSRLKLIDLSAGVQKEEVILEPLISADQPDEGKVLSQIDRVAQARAELEKANARMLLGMRRVLTPEQWKKLQAGERAEGPGMRHPPFDSDRGPRSPEAGPGGGIEGGPHP